MSYNIEQIKVEQQKNDKLRQFMSSQAETNAYNSIYSDIEKHSAEKTRDRIIERRRLENQTKADYNAYREKEDRKKREEIEALNSIFSNSNK